MPPVTRAGVRKSLVPRVEVRGFAVCMPYVLWNRLDMLVLSAGKA